MGYDARLVQRLWHAPARYSRYVLLRRAAVHEADAALLGMDDSPGPGPAPSIDPRNATCFALRAGSWIAAARGVHPIWAVATLALATAGVHRGGRFRAWLVHDAWRGAAAIAARPPPLRDRSLPRYTVLVPLYREANVLPPLVSHLSRIDYPDDRLEILLLCEADDARDDRRHPGRPRCRHVSGSSCAPTEHPARSHAPATSGSSRRPASCA